MNHDEVNEKLMKFNETNNSGAYARLLESGRIELDGRFTLKEVQEVMKIIEGAD